MSVTRSFVCTGAMTLLLTPCALSQVGFGASQEVSVDVAVVPGAADPGGRAAKAKLIGLEKTPQGIHDGRLIAVWNDANHTVPVWHPVDGEHLPTDVFASFSDDSGATWSPPQNLSNTARLFSARTDWNADGTKETFYGDSDKATVFASGDVVVVTWVDKYAPEPTWSWGQTGESALQGTVGYPDPDTSKLHVVPFSAVYAAVSADGGATWIHGGTNPPLQLTYARRDALVDVHKGSGSRWVIAWQEDPAGLQLGEGEGPGEGASGAKVSPGTDVWYTWTPDVVADAVALRTNRTPLSNESAYDTTAADGYPMVGQPGSVEGHGPSRPNIHMVKDGAIFRAIVAYEETKEVQGTTGKTIQYHAFPFDAPVVSGTPQQRSGDTGTRLSTLAENSRRVRFVAQQPNGKDPAIAIFWRQGTGDEGAPADIVLRTSLALDGASIAAAPLLNLSSQTPVATSANLDDPTSLNAVENARAHRAYLRGPLLIVGYSYTSDDTLARSIVQESYDFWIRRTTDGGATWFAPQNISNLPDTRLNVKEPRLVGPANTPSSDPSALVIAWATETNPPSGEAPVPLDIYITRSHDAGATFEPVMPIANTNAPESEVQLRVNDDASVVYAIWMAGESTVDAMYATANNPVQADVHEVPAAPGTDIDVTFRAPGYEGAYYVGAAAFGTRPGLAVPGCTLPLTLDPLLEASLQAPNLFANFIGTMGSTGEANAVIHVPDNLYLRGLQFYVAFVAIPPSGVWGASTPAVVRIE